MRIVARRSRGRDWSVREWRERQRLRELQREIEAAQASGDVDGATQLAQAKLEAHRRLHGVAS